MNINQALARTINHLLKNETWAREKLKPFASKTAQFNLAPLETKLTVQNDGMVLAASSEAKIAVTLTLKPWLLPSILLRDESVIRQAHINGDVDFAETIAFIFRNLRWDVEEDLSKVVGDIVAHRIVETAKGFQAWQKEAQEKMLQNFAEYWTEEQPLLVKTKDVEHFVTEVDKLRDDIERLEKRVQRLKV